MTKYFSKKYTFEPPPERATDYFNCALRLTAALRTTLAILEKVDVLPLGFEMNGMKLSSELYAGMAQVDLEIFGVYLPERDDKMEKKRGRNVRRRTNRYHLPRR